MAKVNIPFIGKDGQLVKKCTKCLKILPATLEFFPENTRSSIGLRAWCIQCTKKQNAIYCSKPENKERQRKRYADYYSKNKDHISAKRKAYYSIPENKEKRKAYFEKYYSDPKNKERKAKQSKEYSSRLETKERLKEWRAKHYSGELNKSKITKYRKEYNKRQYVREKYRKRDRHLYNNDLQYRVSKNVRCLISQSLHGNKKRRHWEDIVGYSFKDLKKHLEKQFTDGMSWENYGEWHIDHIIPVSAFNFETYDDIDFKKCWALDNLQPLWANDNLSKGAKLDKPFQPSLAFGGAL